MFVLLQVKSKEEGKDQESTRSSTIPYQNTIWESDTNTRKHNTQENQEVSPFPAGDHKATRNRLESITKIHMNINNKTDPHKKYRLGMVSKISLEDLNMFSGTNLIHITF